MQSEKIMHNYEKQETFIATPNLTINKGYEVCLFFPYQFITCNKIKVLRNKSSIFLRINGSFVVLSSYTF